MGCSGIKDKERYVNYLVCREYYGKEKEGKEREEEEGNYGGKKDRVNML